VREADVVEGAEAIGFTLGSPRSAWSASSRTSWPTGPSSSEREPAPPSSARSPTSPRRARTSSPTRWPRPRWPARTASRQARSATGCAASARRPPDRAVAESTGVTWVDDSKATNPHAAQSSLQAYDPVVWVAGGLAKGARFDDLVAAVRDRLRGVVLLGATAR
jgi:UDP-N-acetylmuramoylalanine--D-glutamate ligase